MCMSNDALRVATVHQLRTPFEMHQAKMESVGVCAGVVISVDEFKRDFGQLQGARDAIEQRENGHPDLARAGRC